MRTTHTSPLCFSQTFTFLFGFQLFNAFPYFGIFTNVCAKQEKKPNIKKYSGIKHRLLPSFALIFLICFSFMFLGKILLLLAAINVAIYSKTNYLMVFLRFYSLHLNQLQPLQAFLIFPSGKGLFEIKMSTLELLQYC